MYLIILIFYNLYNKVNKILLKTACVFFKNVFNNINTFKLINFYNCLLIIIKIKLKKLYTLTIQTS